MKIINTKEYFAKNKLIIREINNNSYQYYSIYYYGYTYNNLSLWMICDDYHHELYPKWLDSNFFSCGNLIDIILKHLIELYNEINRY